jgi:hypothetical protein
LNFLTLLLVSLKKNKAECDLEGTMEDVDDLKENAKDFVPIRADHITKIAAELLMDFS